MLFDGECGLCRHLVRCLLCADRSGRLRFAALQSPPAQEFLRTHGLPTADFDSLVFATDWAAPPPSAYQLRTDGALAACAVLDRPWRWLAGLRVVPPGIRDATYRFIARRRHRWFGPPPPGLLSRPEWAGRFLDR